MLPVTLPVPVKSKALLPFAPPVRLAKFVKVNVAVPSANVPPLVALIVKILAVAVSAVSELTTPTPVPPVKMLKLLKVRVAVLSFAVPSYPYNALEPVSVTAVETFSNVKVLAIALTPVAAAFTCVMLEKPPATAVVVPLKPVGAEPVRATSVAVVYGERSNTFVPPRRRLMYH